jgi:hypothetical protein
MTFVAAPRDFRRARRARVRRRPPRVLALLAWLALGACDAAPPSSAVVPEDGLALWHRRAPWCAPFLDDSVGEVEEDLREIEVDADRTSTPYRAVTTTGPELAKRVFGRAVRNRGAAATAKELDDWRRSLRATKAIRGAALPPRPTELRWALWRRGDAVLLLMHDPTHRTLFLVGGLDRVVAVDLDPKFVTEAIFSGPFQRR